MGPLQGYRVIELEGIGPAPFAGMLFADLGAEVISVARGPSSQPRQVEICERNKKSISLNLKDSDGLEAILKLCETADIFLEGYRPGVAERLGVGPEQAMTRNPKLVYGRVTGWGQDGPLAMAAGHDINFISLTGALHAIGRKGECPVPPLNLVGDFGGGGMFLAFGVVCALLEAERSGKGQVVDAAMIDGTANLMHMMYDFLSQGTWKDERGSNYLDGAAHFYDTYETADGKYISIGAIEPQFYRLLMEKANLDPSVFSEQNNRQKWPIMKSALKEVMRTKTREEWCKIMEGTDICFAPVLSMTEAPDHPHNKARGTYITLDGLVQGAPAPRFSRTPASVPNPPSPKGSDTDEILRDLGYPEERIRSMKATGAIL